VKVRDGRAAVGVLGRGERWRVGQGFCTHRNAEELTWRAGIEEIALAGTEARGQRVNIRGRCIIGQPKSSKMERLFEVMIVCG